MSEKEVQEIYNRLLELTKAGTIQWKKTDESEYTANFSRSSVALNKEETVFMTVYNEDGLEIAYVAPHKVDVPEPVKEFILDPSELFDLVEEKVYKHSETTENILNELRKLKAS
jgi:hypothetical protein